MRDLRVIAAVLVVMGLLISGCGGDSSGEEADGAGATTVEAVEGLTKAELIAQADEICEAADEEQEKALQRYLKDHPNSQSNPKGQAGAVKEAGLPPIRDEVRELAELGAPPGDEKEIQAIIDGLEKALEEGEAKPQTLLGNTPSPFDSVGKLAAKYGFKACNNAL